MADNPRQLFEITCGSILSLIRCADIYGLHAISLFRGEKPDLALIGRIIQEKEVSLHAYSWQWTMRREEYDEFDNDGHLRSMCEHIVFSSYVAVDAYLKGKFKENLYHMYKAPDQERQNLLLKRISLRSLKEFSEHYWKYLRIKLPDYNHPQVSTYAEAEWFNPTTSWQGLKQLEKCRNQLAHSGRMNSATLVVLVDAMSVFQLCQRYVMLFDANYDSYIYLGRAVKHEGTVK
ncbi:MAG: hypothetical protein ACKOPS_08575 [Cyanobium sp.]